MIATLGAGATCTVAVDVIDAVGTLANVSADLDTDSTTTTVSSGIAVDELTVATDPLSITKTFVNDPTPPGGGVTLEFTIRNLDRFDTATNVAFTDNLAAALAGLALTPWPAGHAQLWRRTAQPAEGLARAAAFEAIRAGAADHEWLVLAAPGGRQLLAAAYSRAASLTDGEPKPYGAVARIYRPLGGSLVAHIDAAGNSFDSVERVAGDFVTAKPSSSPRPRRSRRSRSVAKRSRWSHGRSRRHRG